MCDVKRRGLYICFRLGFSEQSEKQGLSVNLLDEERVSQLLACYFSRDKNIRFIALKLSLF